MTNATLVIGPAWVGDMVMSQVLFSVLKEKWPGTTIGVAAPASTFSLLERMPEIDHGIKLETGHGDFNFGYRAALGKRLRGKYQRAIVLPNSFKSALIPFFAEIPERTGYRGEYRYFLLNDIRPRSRYRQQTMSATFAALAFPPGHRLPDTLPFPSLTPEPANISKLMVRLSLESSRPVVALCPGAEFGESKRWPVAYFAKLAERLAGQGFTCWVLGGSSDTEVGKQIVAHAGTVGPGVVVDLAGQTTLNDVIDLLSLTTLAVSNDSGLMHVACAVGIPTIGIYGSTTPTFTPPLSDQARTVSLDLPCSPCFKRKCPLGHNNCLNQLTVDRVLREIEQLPLGIEPS